ncbi:hypothetical protein [Erythrobacter sp. THAF29]|uniref:hypothetical protein n=1 Tax=Erythrobacter sp. THAF29 TaxID=2587851 RepID=UPI001269271D|nr:hypothetical protein [Erythrobacter sp. THAF29]QFT78501.1 hypothetical protein FIU90_13195 [Erythrobacter sp. THAF29]
MQTLGLLGVNVIGRRFDQHDDPLRQKLHYDLNPGGYFEEPDIYYGGPSSETFRRHLPDRSILKACKMDLRLLIDPSQFDAWVAAAPTICSVLVSYRSPSEQARSEFLTSGLAHTGIDPSGVDPRARFMFITSFLEEYRNNYSAVTKLSHGPLSVLAEKTHVVDFAEIANSRSYVERIAGLAALQPTEKEFDRAVANIDPGLMRIRADELDEHERRWSRNLGADEVFEQLVRLRKKES